MLVLLFISYILVHNSAISTDEANSDICFGDGEKSESVVLGEILKFHSHRLIFCHMLLRFPISSLPTSS